MYTSSVMCIHFFLESYTYQEVKFNSWQFFTCFHKFVSDISSIVEGRHYNRSLLIDTFILEALEALHFTAYVLPEKIIS